MREPGRVPSLGGACWKRCLAVLAAMLAQLGLVVLAQPAFAATQEITGTVTSAVTKAPLAGAEACEYAIEGGAKSACAETDSKGDYILGVGKAGTFVVYFDTTIEGLIPQTIYKSVFVSREATPVKVVEGEIVSGIDQAIEEGGRIAGRVTSRSTKDPIEGAEACAELPDVDQSGVEQHRTCATTNADGEYEIQGLTPGEGVPEGGYEVEFTSSQDYLRQFYNGKPERYSGTTRIPIDAGKTVPNVDAELEEGGEISGRVTSQITNEPIAGAQACADGSCAETNAAGEYTITRLPSGNYTVSFSGPSGLETEYISEYYNEKEGNTGEEVSVTAPHMVGGINASLKAYGGIVGTVVDKETKQPLEGVGVCIVYGSCTTTSRTGEYSFSKLLAGTYALEFDAGRLNEEAGTNYLSQDEAPEWEYIAQERLKARNPEAAHVQVNMGGRAVIDDGLEEGGRISGTVQEANTGTPTSLWPCVEDLSTGHSTHSTICPYSESAGGYSIAGLPPGRYRVVFGGGLPAYYFLQYYDDKDAQSEAQEVLVESGENVEHIDANAIPNPDPWQGAIAGTVTNSSSKAVIAGIEVCPLYLDREPAGSCTTTNSDGEYLLVGLANGEYEVEFRSPPNGSLDYVHQRYGGGKTVTVLWGNITPAIDAQLYEGGGISGLAGNAVTGRPESGVSVCAYNAIGESEACATTGVNGSYRLAGLAEGNYKVGFDVTGPGAYFPQYFDEATSAAEARSVPVEVRRTTGSVDAFLFTYPQSGDGAIGGRVTDVSTSAPLAGIDVCAYNIDLEGLFGECTVSSADGYYLLAGLAPGEYEVEFSSPANSDISYVNARYEAGRPVEVTAGAIAAGRDAQLTAGGMLAGTVTSDASGNPVQGALVCAADESQEVVACAPSTADGSYAITGLSGGNYTVIFYGAEVGFATEYYDEALTPATAKTITLSAGETIGNIDARLHGGGTIHGLVTSAASRRPLSGVLICALSAQEMVGECAASEANGEYTIAGVPPGQWCVGFDAGGYQVQFYNGVGEFTAASPLSVVAGAGVTNVNAAMIKPSEAPVSSPPPVSHGEPPHESVPSTTSTTTSTTTASSGVLGTSSAKIAPSISLSSSMLTLSGRAVKVDVVCDSAPCGGSVVLTERIAAPGRSHGKRHQQTQTIVLGRGSFMLASGARGTVLIDLTHAGARTFARARHGRPMATLSIVVQGGSTLTRSVRITSAR